MRRAALTRFWWDRASPRQRTPSRRRVRSPGCRGERVGTDIKICGLTRSVDAEYADAAGVEYLGVIFAGGPRERTPSQARDTLAGRRARKAGVFAEQAEDVIASIVEVVGLDVIQLHGGVDAERVER